MAIARARWSTRRGDQMGSTRVARAMLRWRSTMQNIMGNARQSAEACRIIEISHYRQHPVRAQQRCALRVASQAVIAIAFAQMGQRAQRHVAATDDE